MIPLKRIARITAAIGTVGLAAALGRRFYQKYNRDIRAAYAAVEDADTDRIETSVGTVQYKTQGTGVPVLVAHGIFGGFDQALQTGEGLLDADAKIIGVSRFGYLGSELPADPTPESQARAYADLLDELGIDTVAVVGTSAGGAPAIRFALDYPERTRALLLIGSAAPSEQELTGPTGLPHAILSDPVIWFLVNYVPQVFLALFGVDRSDYESTPRDERRRMQALLDTLVPVRPRTPGIYNDERVTNRVMAEQYSQYDLESMAVPTLVIHATDDPLASFEDIERLVEQIPTAEFQRYETGDHLVFGHGDEIRQSVTDFVASPDGETDEP